MRLAALLAFAPALVSCSQPIRHAPDHDVVDAVHALVVAEPLEWLARGETVLAHGSAAVPALITELRARPGAAGAQPAIAILGALGEQRALPLLQEILRADGPHAYEAALAMGRTKVRAATSELLPVLLDPRRTPLVRAASAAALLDLGQAKEAVAFFYALFTVDTSAAGPAVREQGLSSKPRWALERNVAIDAIRRSTGGETFGLDADAPWPQLAAAAAKMRTHFEAGPKR